MSDDWIRIVPSDPDHVPSDERAQAAVSAVEALISSAEDVTIHAADQIVFIDAGENQGSARCPQCGADLEDAWWAGAMSDSYERSHFAVRRVVLPCCSALSDLNELDYGQWPVTFGRWWIDCRNPAEGRLAEHQIRQLSEVLGHPVRIVYRHI